MSSIHCPEKDLIFHKLMVLMKRRLFFRQNIKIKHRKFGVNLCELRESSSLLWRATIYSSTSFSDLFGTGQKGATFLQLLYECINSFHNSVKLTKKRYLNLQNIEKGEKGQPKIGDQQECLVKDYLFWLPNWRIAVEFRALPINKK